MGFEPGTARVQGADRATSATELHVGVMLTNSKLVSQLGRASVQCPAVLLVMNTFQHLYTILTVLTGPCWSPERADGVHVFNPGEKSESAKITKYEHK